MTSMTTIPPRPPWFEAQMHGRSEAERAAEWAGRCRSDYDRDDASSRIMLNMLEGRARRRAFEAALREIVAEINGNVVKFTPKH